MLTRSTAVAPEAGESGHHRFDINEVLNFVWRQWVFIATVFSVVAVIGVVSLVRETPRYTAMAQILLEPQKEKATADAIFSDLVLNPNTIESQMQIIRSTVLLRRVVEKENLAADPELGSPSLPPAPMRAADSERIPPQIMAAILGLKGALLVTQDKGFIINVAFTSVDPRRAGRLANAVADAYIVDKLDARFEAATRASRWFSDRLAEMRRQVAESEEAVRKFRAEHNLLEGTSKVTLTEQQLGDLNGRLVAARAEMSEKKARVDLLKSIADKGGSVQGLLPELINSPVVAGLRTQITSAAQREADLVARYGNGHPLVVNVRSERRDLERNLANEIKKLSANVENEYELAKARADSLEASLREVTGQVDYSNSAIVALRELEKTAAINQTVFEDFLKRSKITQEQSTFETREARVITPALQPTEPSSPKKFRYMTIVVMIGLFLGVGGAVAKELLNAGFTTPKQIEDYLEMPLLSSVARMDARDLTIGNRQILIPQYPVVKPLARFSESIRAIRSGVQMSDVDHPPKVIQLTSTIPGEGKTTIALSIAASAAASGLRTLFIDADLRRPSATGIVGMKNQHGLVDMLLGQADAQTAIQYNEDLSFWILGAGTKTQSPTDLLSSDRMKTFMDGFKKSFDFIVIDSPPMGPVIDPIVIAGMADKIVFVVRWAVTAREMVRHSIQRLAADRKVAGIVFNHVNDKKAQRYGKYAYSYYYSASYYKNYYTE
jgi:succinoglycan biosynthesis transport protein ExoP